MARRSCWKPWVRPGTAPNGFCHRAMCPGLGECAQLGPGATGFPSAEVGCTHLHGQHCRHAKSLFDGIWSFLETRCLYGTAPKKNNYEHCQSASAKSYSPQFPSLSWLEKKTCEQNIKKSSPNIKQLNHPTTSSQNFIQVNQKKSSPTASRLPCRAGRLPTLPPLQPRWQHGLRLRAAGQGLRDRRLGDVRRFTSFLPFFDMLFLHGILYTMF